MNGKTKLLILIAAILVLAVVIVLMVSAGNGSTPDAGNDPVGETQTTQAEGTGDPDATDGMDATQSVTDPTENGNQPQPETTVPATTGEGNQSQPEATDPETTEPTVEKPTIGPPDDGKNENNASGEDNVIDFNDLLEAAGGGQN